MNPTSLRRRIATGAATLLLTASFIALTAPDASAGDVTYTRCGGTGTTQAVRIDGVSGSDPTLNPGKPYPVEVDLIPSSAAPALHLNVTADYLGFPVEIINTNLADSSVQAGVQYTVRFTVTPNDILVGNRVPLRITVSHENTGLVEICDSVPVRIER
ncbi:hypothetical protein OG500_00170 [Kitasatospora sp. NBC_01250]|uniref:hypothetical protein n=1 Tax=Kitasatospora sp. NBC_01250 TaxID=2903571 RepID=UPI002E32D001|nr:hypothetical protein [Kitasatospora sp. NBC_01250]